MKQQATETFEYCAEVRNITPNGFWMGGGGPDWSENRNVFVPRSQIVECDSALDDVEVGEEITVEIPLWLAKDRGLV